MEKLTQGIVFSSRRDEAESTTRTLPDAVVAHPLGVRSEPEYAKAKAGDIDAAGDLAQKLIGPDEIGSLRDVLGDSEDVIIVGVRAIESAGDNMIPFAAAMHIADRLNATVSLSIVQSAKANRGGLSGLDRVFRTVSFDGTVEKGRRYLLVDDTLTQGGTFAELAAFVRKCGGEVAGIFALTGKQYSRKLSPSEEILKELRALHGDLEESFRQATGYGYDSLTESEARTLARFRPAHAVRDRILAEADRGGR